MWARLASIAHDAMWVRDVAVALWPRYAVVPNERCGTWYTDPAVRYHGAQGPSVYFKSTDGHNGDFSLRRLNVHMLALLADRPGIILVDSTGRGKRIPDSFSRTVPIWCAVLNRALRVTAQQCARDHAAAGADWDTDLHTPSVVSEEHRTYFATRLDGFVAALLALELDMTTLLSLVKKPLRALWVTPASRFFSNQPPDHGECTFTPIVCVTASEHIVDFDDERDPPMRRLRLPGFASRDFVYTAGAGDDHETWACGLTPALFWEHWQQLLSAPASECEQRVRRLVQSSGGLPAIVSAVPSSSSSASSRVQLLGWLPVHSVYFESGAQLGIAACVPADSMASSTSGAFVVASPTCVVFDCNGSTTNSAHAVCLGIAPGKAGRAAFAAALPDVLMRILDLLAAGTSVVVAAVPGSDAAAGIALATLIAASQSSDLVNKHSIAQHIAQLVAQVPGAQPSRGLLKEINTHFLTHPHHIFS